MSQLEALEERRAMSIRHARYNAALIAAAVYNANSIRTPDVEPLSPFDFIPGFEEDPAEAAARKARKEAIKVIRFTLMGLPKNCGPERVQEEKRRMIANMKANGMTDAEEVFREAFPTL